jgi:hypothetical protein
VTSHQLFEGRAIAASGEADQPSRVSCHGCNMTLFGPNVLSPSVVAAWTTSAKRNLSDMQRYDGE